MDGHRSQSWSWNQSWRQAALVLAGPHRSLPGNPEPLGASLSTEEREVGRRANMVIPAKARDEQNPEKARVGFPTSHGRQGPSQVSCRTLPGVSSSEKRRSQNLGCGHLT